MEAAQCPVNLPLQLHQDQIPDLMPISFVAVLTGMSVATIRKNCTKGNFPQPRRFSAKKIFWRKADVLSFLSCKEIG